MARGIKPARWEGLNSGDALPPSEDVFIRRGRLDNYTRDDRDQAPQPATNTQPLLGSFPSAQSVVNCELVSANYFIGRSAQLEVMRLRHKGIPRAAEGARTHSRTRDGWLC